MPRRPTHSASDHGWLFGDDQGPIPSQPPVAPSSRPGTKPVPLPAPQPPAIAALAQRLPTSIRIGTSSWSFPSWQGLVYAQEASETVLARQGLHAYARHPVFRAVGLDRTYYRPMHAVGLAELASQTPAHFRFLVKAHAVLTVPPGVRTRGEDAAPTGSQGGFLDASWARDQVIGPALEGLGSRLGVVLFQFPPMDASARRALGHEAGFLDRLEKFVRACSEGWPGGAVPPLAIEVRNTELFGPAYATLLHALGVAHGYTGHPTMPTLREQREVMGSLGPPAAPVTLRWLLHPAQRYEAAKARYFPFQRIVDPDVPARDDILALVREALAVQRDMVIIINNKAEGSAPLSAIELAGLIAASVPRG